MFAQNIARPFALEFVFAAALGASAGVVVLVTETLLSGDVSSFVSPLFLIWALPGYFMFGAIAGGLSFVGASGLFMLVRCSKHLWLATVASTLFAAAITAAIVLINALETQHIHPYGVAIASAVIAAFIALLYARRCAAQLPEKGL